MIKKTTMGVILLVIYAVVLFLMSFAAIKIAVVDLLRKIFKK